MFIPSTDIAQYWWLKTIGASAEDEYIEMVCSILKERQKGIAIDVGANFGCWTLPIGMCATRVMCFEPQRPIFNLLRKTVAANPSIAAECHNLAVGDAPGVISVPILDLDAAANFGGVTLGIEHHEQPNAKMEDVRVVALDDLVFLSEETVSFIKADVEGFEPAVLRGAHNVISRYRPLLFVEAVHRFTDTDALKQQIENMGYATSAHGPNLLGIPL